MSHQRRTAPFVLLLILALALVGCGGATVEPSAPITVRFAMLPVLDALPMFVAQSKGYFAEENITLEIVPVASAAERDQLMQAGQADAMVNDLISTLFYNQADQQIVITRFARTATADFAQYFILAGKDSGITKIEDLKGKAKLIVAKQRNGPIGDVNLVFLKEYTKFENPLEDLDELNRLAGGMEAGSLCGLGQLAPSPVRSVLRHFQEEFRTHILDRACPARKCKALISFVVIPELCTGCMVCARNCASNAITGEKLQVHHIDPDLCERCGLCAEVCKFNAIEIVSPR